MQKEQFREWLKSKMSTKPASDCISKCMRVERCLGIDLDSAYSYDSGRSLLAKLCYTIEDERNHKPAPSEFGFRSGVCVRFRMTDLRAAVNKYFHFISEN